MNDVAIMYMIANNNKPSGEDRDKLVQYTEDLIHYINQNRKEISDPKMEITYYNNYASMVNVLPHKNLTVEQRNQLAEKYILKAIDMVKRLNLEVEYGIVYTTYAEILEMKGDSKKAKEYYLKSYQVADISELNKNNYHIGFTLKQLANLSTKENDYRQAFGYLNLANKFDEKLANQKVKEKNEFLEAYLYTTENIQKMTDLENQSLKLSKQRNFSIGIILLASLFIIFLVYTLRTKSVIARQKNELLLSEKNEAQLQLQLETEEKARPKAEQQLLEIKQEQLAKQALAATLQLEQKNTFIQEIKEKLQSNSEISWNQILKEDKLKDDDFNEIQIAIQEVHPQFFKKLKEVSLSKLSPMDLKYATYIYLNMDNHQIANMLNVAQNTVRMSKYRLKQKIGLGKDDDLAEFLHNLQV